jgi:hypothetical protein
LCCVFDSGSCWLYTDLAALWDLRFSLQWILNLAYSCMWHLVIKNTTTIQEECASSTFGVSCFHVEITDGTCCWIIAVIFHWPSKYEVWQFNSRNGPVKAEFAYLCTNSCSCLQNTLIVNLCTFWDDGATPLNSIENHFPEYLTVTWRCVVLDVRNVSKSLSLQSIF